MARAKNLAKLLAGLTDAELDSIRELVKENPEVTELKKKKAALLAEVERIDARIAELSGGVKRRGRKPGKPARAVAAKAPLAKRGRPAKADKAAKPGMSEETKEKKRQALARARAAKAAKRIATPDAIAGEAMPKVKRQRRLRRVIVDNDLIPPK